MIQKISFLVLGLASLVASASVHASDWQHRSIRTYSGIQVNFDFQTDYRARGSMSCLKCPDVLEAAPLWLNVIVPNANGREQIRAVVTNVGFYDFGSNPRIANSNQVDLAYAGNGRFTAQLPNMDIDMNGYGSRALFKQRIALVINGNWIPMNNSGSHDQELSLY